MSTIYRYPWVGEATENLRKDGKMAQTLTCVKHKRNRLVPQNVVWVGENPELFSLMTSLSFTSGWQKLNQWKGGARWRPESMLLLSSCIFMWYQLFKMIFLGLNFEGHLFKLTFFPARHWPVLLKDWFECPSWEVAKCAEYLPSKSGWIFLSISQLLFQTFSCSPPIFVHFLNGRL